MTHTANLPDGYSRAQKLLVGFHVAAVLVHQLW